AGVALGGRREAGSTGAVEPARHALDGDLVARRGHPRHEQRLVDRLLRLARLHPDARSGCRVAVRPRLGRDAGLHRRALTRRYSPRPGGGGGGGGPIARRRWRWWWCRSGRPKTRRVNMNSVTRNTHFG